MWGMNELLSPKPHTTLVTSASSVSPVSVKGWPCVMPDSLLFHEFILTPLTSTKTSELLPLLFPASPNS